MNEIFVQARYLTTEGEMLVFVDYEVSNYGQVRNKKTGRFLAISHFKTGYCYVRPYINGKEKPCLLHRLVLSSFTDNVDGSLQVNHKDENKDNNCLNNLEWMTAKENSNYGTRNECISKPVFQYDKNGNFIREWISMSEVERQLGIYKSHISSCCNGKLKSTGGYVWRYKKEET